MSKNAKASGKRKPRLLSAAVTIRDHAASRKKSDELFVYVKGSDGRYILSLYRLKQIEDALRRGDPLDDRARAHVLELLDYVATLHNNEACRGAGRPKRFTTMDIAVDIVRVLHDQRGIKLAAAVSAMVLENVGTEDSRRKLRQNIERAYRAAKKNSGRQPLAAAKDVEEALARINPPQNRK